MKIVEIIPLLFLLRTTHASSSNVERHSSGQLKGNYNHEFLQSTEKKRRTRTAGSCIEKDLDLNSIDMGEYISTQLLESKGVRISAIAKNSNGYTPNGAARVFDSSRPTASRTPEFHNPLCHGYYGEGNAGLGSPNADFGGPGIGRGGEEIVNGTANPFKNDRNQGHTLIIQESKRGTPGDTGNYRTWCPDDSNDGGIIRFDFDRPVYLKSIDFFIGDDAITSSPEILILYEHGKRKSIMPKVPEKNGMIKQRINLGEVSWAQIKFHGSGSVADLKWLDCPKTHLTATDPVCDQEQVVDFNEFKAGQYISNNLEKAHGLVVKAVSLTDNGYTEEGARLFDTRYPTGNMGQHLCGDNDGNPDLGSPNFHCNGGGPGFGRYGKPGASYNGVLTENCTPVGNVMIIQEGKKDCPVDDDKGGRLLFTFKYPVELGYVELFGTDNEPTHIKVTQRDSTEDVESEFVTPGTGSNGIRKQWVNKRLVTMLTIELSGGGGLSSLMYRRPCRQLTTLSTSFDCPAESGTITEVAKIVTHSNDGDDKAVHIDFVKMKHANQCPPGSRRGRKVQVIT